MKLYLPISGIISAWRWLRRRLRPPVQPTTTPLDAVNRCYWCKAVRPGHETWCPGFRGGDRG